MTLAWCGAGICYLGFEEKRTLEQVRNFFPGCRTECAIRKRQKNWLIGLSLSKTHGPLEQGARVNQRWSFAERRFRKACGKRCCIFLQRTRCYLRCGRGDISAKPKAVTRAVGSAVGANPVSLLIPCHRVIQGNGSLKNYGWGDAVKESACSAKRPIPN
jgi:O-6-methylguanine DNA methyltransferase